MSGLAGCEWRRRWNQQGLVYFKHLIIKANSKQHMSSSLARVILNQVYAVYSSCPDFFPVCHRHGICHKLYTDVIYEYICDPKNINIQPTPVQWAVRKGRALPTVTVLMVQEMTIMCLFVCLLCRPANHWHQTKHLQSRVAASNCLNPCIELSPAQRKEEQQQYITSLNQLFVQHKGTVMVKMNETYLSCPWLSGSLKERTSQSRGVR